MSMTPKTLLHAALFTVKDPRAGARAVLEMGLSLQTGATALLLMAVCSTMLSSVIFLYSPMRDDPELAKVFGNPVLLAAVQVAVLALMALVIHVVGRRFDGKGDLAGAVVLTAWLEFVLVLLQVMQLVSLFLPPVIAEALGLLGFVLFIWLLVEFIKELHGFASAIKVLFMILATFLATLFAISLLFAVVLMALGGDVTNV